MDQTDPCNRTALPMSKLLKRSFAAATEAFVDGPIALNWWLSYTMAHASHSSEKRQSTRFRRAETLGVSIVFVALLFSSTSCNSDGVTSVTSQLLNIAATVSPDSAQLSNGELVIRIRVYATNPTGKRLSVDLGSPPYSSGDPRTNRGTLFGFRVYKSGTLQLVGPSTDQMGNSSVAVFEARETKIGDFGIDLLAPFGLGLSPGVYDVVGVFNRSTSVSARLVVAQ